jgi:hypothetical protein
MVMAWRVEPAVYIHGMMAQKKTKPSLKWVFVSIPNWRLILNFTRKYLNHDSLGECEVCGESEPPSQTMMNKRQVSKDV